jgi:hypothetical protein
LIPIGTLFRKVSETPGVFKKVFQQIEWLKKLSTFTNFFHSPLWKKKIDHLKNELVLPYFMYFDDFVADNNLGTHVKAHSMDVTDPNGAEWLWLPTANPEVPGSNPG